MSTNNNQYYQTPNNPYSQGQYFPEQYSQGQYSQGQIPPNMNNISPNQMLVNPAYGGAQGGMSRTNNLIIQNQGPINPVVPQRTSVSTIANQNQHFQMLSYNNNIHQTQPMRQPPAPQSSAGRQPPPPTPVRQTGPKSPKSPNGRQPPPPLPTRQMGPQSSGGYQSQSPPPKPPARQMGPQSSGGYQSPPHKAQSPPPPLPPSRQTGPQSSGGYNQQQQQQQQQSPPKRQQSNNSQRTVSTYQSAISPAVQPSNVSQRSMPTHQSSQTSQRSTVSHQGSHQGSQPLPLPNRNVSNYSNSGNVQINDPSGLSQRKQLPKPPNYDPNSGITRNKSFNSIQRNASTLKTKFANMMNRVPSIRRTFSTKDRVKNRRQRLSVNGGVSISTIYENSKKAPPIFENQLIMKPQNPNFIISLGIVVMIAAVTLTMGIMANAFGGLSERDIHDISTMDVQGFFFFSFFLLLIALTGGISYYKKWNSLLITFNVFIAFAFFVQIIIIILFVSIYHNPVVQMRNKWELVLSDVQKSTIQTNYECCGFLSITDGVNSIHCDVDNNSYFLSKLPGKAIKNTQSVSLRKRFFKRQNAVTTNDNSASTTPQDKFSRIVYRSPDSYTVADIKPEGCGNIIIDKVKGGLLKYIIIECIMALLFLVALYFSAMHFKEQLLIPKKLNLDAAKVTFG